MHEHTNHDTVRHCWLAVEDREYFLAISAAVQCTPLPVGCDGPQSRLCGGDKNIQTRDIAKSLGVVQMTPLL